VVKGNHDAESQISRQLPALEGLHVFSSSNAETIELPALEVAIHGRSFPNRAVNEDLVPAYPAAHAGWFNIGMLHTSLTGRDGHDDYAPTSVEVLASKGYDYFALGHVHAREVVRESDPRIVYPGNLQGRWARETGAKGCELVTVTDAHIVDAQFVALDVVRWHLMRLDLSGVATLDALRRRFLGAALELVAGANEKLHAMRVILSGQTPLHQLEARQPGTLAATLQAATQDFDDADLWIEQVRLNLRSPVDRAAAAARTDAIGEVARLVEDLLQDDEGLRTWITRQLADMGALPGSLAELQAGAMTAQELQALLADAEATVLAQLAGDGKPSAGAAS
ncbi:MAG: metallophosphoesterase family protein, partial [Janthinobacterium lividum]